MAKKLLREQLAVWELARKNFGKLKDVHVREFDFGKFKIQVQFNPSRIISSAAKVDKKSIANRACFLCEKNRPREQQSVQFGNYVILINPFPIFTEHFTIPTFEHTPQLIDGNFGDMLNLSKAIPGFAVFYNGPKCGASAPDHFHFQAGTKDFMPLSYEIDSLKNEYGKKLPNKELDIWSVKDGLRNFFVLESSGKEVLESSFEQIYKAVETISRHKEEPLMNILASYNAVKWRVLVFPRAKHRPWQYFEEGAGNILLSPASVDLGGVLVAPLEKDFRKISKEDITDIFHQILLPDDKFDKLTELIDINKTQI